ncbi:hypothetical protein MG293_017223 [Ovis ammon polii]|uniref:Low density lipoprotein receptor class A domain containing 4 n=1 Tax=Ovis ammon polii TaxID=230172 RepID=A0AAD4TV20_OVIAM|nr:hypothetical protein MG293_017223 [Ovis ammon polii]
MPGSLLSVVLDPPPLESQCIQPSCLPLTESLEWAGAERNPNSPQRSDPPLLTVGPQCVAPWCIECKFTCTSGQCLYLGSLVCNQQNDCGDNSDEENCLLVTEHPPPGIFSCKATAGRTQITGFPSVASAQVFGVIAELEFAQVVVVVVVVTVMVVVIFCLLNHYRASTRSFIHRPGQGQRQEDRPQLPESGKEWDCWLLPPDPQEQCRCLQTHRDRGLQVSPEGGLSRLSLALHIPFLPRFLPASPCRAGDLVYIESSWKGSSLEKSDDGCPRWTMYAPRSRDGVTAPPFLQRDRFSRFQPTYPYVQHEIDLPPTISLSDGEEPPPYQGPCTLQLRDPEQQMELNRESVRAPPNRTVFDSDLIGVSVYSGGPCPPSSNSGISASTCSSTGRMAGPPPAYSEAMGHYPGATPSHPQHSGAHRGSRLLLQREGPGARSCPSRARTGSPGSAPDLRAHLM